MNAAAPAAARTQVSVDVHPSAYVSTGRDASGAAVALIDGALVRPDGRDGGTSILLASSTLAGMVLARVSQGLTPFRADARFDGVCWQVDRILPDGLGEAA